MSKFHRFEREIGGLEVPRQFLKLLGLQGRDARMALRGRAEAWMLSLDRARK